MRAIPGILTSISCLYAGRLSGQNSSYVRLATDALSRAATVWTPRGFQSRGEPRIAVLNTNEADTLSLHLVADSQYIFLAVCDRDCGEIYLKVNDPLGKPVVWDDHDHAHPALEINPKTSGDYQLRVMMASCSTEPCYYAVQLLGKSAPPH